MTSNLEFHHVALSDLSDNSHSLLSTHLPPLVRATAKQRKAASINKMDKVQFVCKFETVQRKEVLVSLFQSASDQVKDGVNDEFLMHLDAEIPDQGKEKVQEAEFVIIVDRFV